MHDVVVTSFALARLDEKLLRSLEWRRVVVDEAQNIKNPQSAQARAIGKLAARHRLALTGTPVENRLLDLWSIFNFLHPGYLGKQAQFRRTFETPIQKDHDLARSATLKRLVEPFILRRLKTDKRIIDDLPDKVEQTIGLQPDPGASVPVRSRRQGCRGAARACRGHSAARADAGHAHEAEADLQSSGPVPPRRQRLHRRAVPQAPAPGRNARGGPRERRQRAGLHPVHRDRLGAREVPGPHPPLSHRRTCMAEPAWPNASSWWPPSRIPSGEPSVFILSLRAGGVGLNLTRASHVFHFDRWWNPAVEDQATDRAFRIGQHKNVFVHKFVASGTLEERIDQLIEDKKRLSSTIIGSDESWLTELDNDTFKQLIALQRSAVVE